MPAHYGYQRYEQKIEKTNRQQIFPFQIQQLVYPEPGKRPPEPHDKENEKKCFSKEPNHRGNVIHDVVEVVPVAYVQWHPSSKKQRGADSTYNKDVDVFCEEEESEFHPG